MRQSRTLIVGDVSRPMASGLAVGGLVSLVWVGVAGLLAWNTLSAGIADLIVSMI